MAGIPHTFVPIDQNNAVIRLHTTTQALIDSWHKAVDGIRSGGVDSTWAQGRVAGMEYALSLILDVSMAEMHRSLMAGEIPPSP